MTTIAHKPVARIVDASMIRDGSKLRALVVTIYPHGFLGLRPKGTRREEIVTLAHCWSLAVKQRVAHELADKKAARAARRGAR